MSRGAKIVCFGIAVADRVYEVQHLPAGEGKVTATGYRETGGGIAATAAVAIAALGGHAVFAGALGNDPAGHFLRAEMTRIGVDFSWAAIDADRRTPTACVMVDATGERCAVVDRGTVWPAVPAASVLADARAVLADHRYPREAASLLAGLPDTVPGVLDAEGGERAALQAMVSAARYPVFSRNGLEILTGLTDPAAALMAVTAERAIAIGVTLGAAGSLWRIDGVLHARPAPHVPVADTTGCGDVFHGAFSLALAEGATVLPAAVFASAAAAIKAREGRGWLGMGARSSVMALIEAQDSAAN